MARSVLMHRLQRMARTALAGAVTANGTASGVAARRRFLRSASALALAGAIPCFSRPAFARGAEPRVLIIGAGLAGLTAAWTLRRAGVHATLHEGSPRIGGRCWSDSATFADGQIAERGGELIDTTHTHIRALAAELGLELDDLLDAQVPGATGLMMFDGAPYTAQDADRDFARVLPALAADVEVLGDVLPSYRRHTQGQRALDRMSAAQWIDTRVPGGRRSRFGRLLVNAYTEELGGDPEEISAVTVVSLLAGSPQDRFSPYEESDQRFHIRGGNGQLAERLAAPLSGQIETRSRLVALAREADGRPRLTLLRDGAERVETADRVVLALPFSLLRVVDLAGAGFRPLKLRSIRELGMGRNTKLQLQFGERFWLPSGDGAVRIEGPFQTTWEVTRAQSGRAGILNFFSGGQAAERAGQGDIEARSREALDALGNLKPRALAAWNGRRLRNAWDRNPWSLGSYALIRPGQYTSFLGIEGEREGQVYFAGEHTSANAQGYLEGAVESGQRAAGQVLASLGASRMAVTPGAAAR